MKALIPKFKFREGVWFDDFKVEVTKSKVAAVSDYYPFGMLRAGNSTNSSDPTGNKYLYNGKELQEELGLQWYDYGARMYQADVGRWFYIDLYSDLYDSYSSYNYALNNPISVIDPDGRLVVYVNGFRLSAYARYLVAKQSLPVPIPGYPAPPWIHKERFHPYDKYEYWGDFDIQIGRTLNEDRLYVDGMYKPLSTGVERFKRGEREGKILAQKIKAGEIDLKGETIKLVGDSHGGAHAMGMAQGLLDEDIDPELITVILFAPHQPNQIQEVKVTVYQFSRKGDKVSSKGLFGSEFEKIEGAKLITMEDGNEDGLGNHGIETYTAEEFKRINPKLYQYLIDNGIINEDGSINNE